MPDKSDRQEKPVNFKVGRVRASVWKNESDAGPWYSVSFSRLYKDKEGKWQDGTSFSREDLPLLIKAADQAHTHLYQDRPEAGTADEEWTAFDEPLPGAARGPYLSR
jgi:hypothetical protein